MRKLSLSTASSSFALTTAILLGAVSPALAQDASVTGQAPPDTAPVDEPAGDDDMILVVGARLIGQVEASQPPILELSQADIAAYGAGSISELITQLGPQVSSGRGRGGGQPVILVNGVRIANFRELRSYPPEAIEKFEVFPEEVALRYGYSADQRVINVILKNNYASREVELDYEQPWDGGTSSQEVEATYLRIAGPSRLNINLGWENASLLTEAERGVVQSSAPTFASDPDPALYRSLVSDTAGLEGTLNWSTRIGVGNSLSLTASYERSDSLRLQGLDSVVLVAPGGASALRTFNAGNPLGVDTRDQSYSAGATLDLNLGDWQVTGTADLTLGRSLSTTDREVDGAALVAAAAAGTLAIDADLGAFADAGVDLARSRTYTANTLVTARTRPVYLPGGDVSLTLDVEGRWNGIRSTDTRNPGVTTDLSRQRLATGVNLAIPLTSRDEDFLAAVGDITLNLSAGVDDLSDFGTLYDWSAGVTWGLTEKLSVNATYLNRDTAPTLSQLGSPELATPNVQVFDLTRNETALVTLITGGNPLLPAQNQSDWKFGVQWELPFLDNARFTADYINNSSTDVTTSFPLLTPDIEAAFPGRVTRDSAGRLVQIDQRPITYARQDQERLQFGLNLSGQIGSSEAQGNGGAGGRGAGAPGAGGFAGGGQGGPAAGGPAGGPVGAGPAGGPLGGGAGGPPSGFRPDPERFAQMRATFCGADPEVLRAQLNEAVRAAAAGEPPPIGADGQLLALPPAMLQRLSGEDGVIDQGEFEALRNRICLANPGAPGGPGAGGGFAAGGPPAGAGGPGAGGPGAGGPGGGGFRLPFGGPGGQRGGNGGRWFVNLQYTYELDSTVLIAPGLPVLDLLDRDGNQPRHSGSLRVGTFYKGFGLIWNGTYTGQSVLGGTGLAGSTDLRFNDYATLNVRGFVDLGQQASLVEAVPFLAGSRLSLGMDNIFDTRQRVTDSTGAVPLRYQPFLIDPVGRSFEIEFRKLF